MESLATYTVPLMEAYASRVGADFKKLGKSKVTEELSPYYEKTQIFDLLNLYERVLFIDCDILITPDAENLFDYSTNDSVAAISVEDVYPGAQKEKSVLSQLLGEVDWVQPYFNSGVVLFTSTHKNLLNRTDGLIEKWIKGKELQNIKGLNDQSVFNYRVNKYSIPINYLDPAFNFTKAQGHFEERFGKHFIHYAGMKGNRHFRVRLDRKIIDNRLIYNLFKNNAKLSKTFDFFSLRINHIYTRIFN